MSTRKTAIIFFSFCLIIAISATETGAVVSQLRPDQLHSYVRQGIEKVFNLEPQNASAYLQKAVDLDRENPMGYAFFALANLFFYEISLDQKATHPSLKRQAGKYLTVKMSCAVKICCYSEDPHYCSPLLINASQTVLYIASSFVSDLTLNPVHLAKK